MHDRLHLATNAVRLRIDALLRTFPDLSDDAELLASALEGETDFEEVLTKLVDAIQGYESLEAGAKERGKALLERSDMFGRKADGLRSLTLDLMHTAGQKLVRLPIATVSIGHGRARAVVDDEDELPQGFVKIKRVPMLTEIAAALAVEGGNVPGAHLEPAREHVTIRVK